MKRVFLIDSMSHIFRAYFAPMGARQEPLRNSKGQVTQAVFVFTNMLRKLLKDENPDYIAAVFDTIAPTFRHESFAAYKANREDMPEDLSTQIPYIIRVCEAFCIPILKMDGFEADDVIGTLAQKVADKGMQAVIVSNDKDLCQLVRDPHVVAMRQNSQNIKRKVPVPPIEWCDEAWVQNKFGVPPSKIIDLLGLMGDSVDNIPGAPGIGAKGALTLVQQFGSAMAAMEHADEVKHKTQRESLLNNQELIKQSLELATIHCEVPVTLDLDDLKHCEPDRKKAYELFRELEFKSLMNEFAETGAKFTAPRTMTSGGLFDDLPTHTGGATGEAVEAKYEMVKTGEELDKLIRRLFEVQTFSFQVDDANSNEKSSCYEKLAPHGVAVGFGNGEAFYIDIDNFGDGKEVALKHIGDILSNPFLYKVALDAKRNAGVLLKMGIKPEPIHDDVMIAAYLLDPARSNYPIDHLAQVYLDVDIARAVPDGWTKKDYQTVETADIVARLAPALRQKLADNDQFKIYADIELPIVDVLTDMELVGMKVDGDALNAFSKDITTKLGKLQTRLYEIA